MSHYGSTTTTDEVLEGIDLTGTRVVISGAASGLGKESARALAAHGASVTVLARSMERSAGAVANLETLEPHGDFEAGVVDLADCSTIHVFADSFLSTHESVDILINNAGVMACPFESTADGFERQFGTNHLGHFLLTALMAPALLKSPAPRVVTLSSAGRSRSDVDLADPNFERTKYSPWIAYGRSKTANALFARELGRRAGPSRLLSFSIHPGAIITDLGRHLTDELINEMAAFADQRTRDTQAAGHDADSGTMTWKSVEAGAATQVWAATASELTDHNGAYLADCGLGVLGANPGTNGFMPYLLDDDHATSLWELSENLVGTSFTL